MTKPMIVQGKHTTFIYWPNGKVDMETDWDKLAAEVREAIANHEAGKAKPIRRRQRKLKLGKQPR